MVTIGPILVEFTISDSPSILYILYLYFCMIISYKYNYGEKGSLSRRELYKYSGG